MFNNAGRIAFCGKKKVISRILALLFTVTAIYILWGIWAPFIRGHKLKSLFDFISLLDFRVPCTFLAIYFFHVGIILRRGISSKGIYKLSVCLSLLFSALILVIFLGIKESVSPKDTFSLAEVPISLIMIAGGIFFLKIKPSLFKCFSVNEVIDYVRHKVATKLFFGFLALLIWFDFAGKTKFLPKDPNYEYLPDNQWLAGLIIFGSIPLAICCYRIGLKLFLKKPPNIKNNDEAIMEFLDAESSPI